MLLLLLCCVWFIGIFVCVHMCGEGQQSLWVSSSLPYHYYCYYRHHYNDDDDDNDEMGFFTESRAYQFGKSHWPAETRNPKLA